MTRFDPMDMLNLRRRDRDSQARQRCEASSRTRFIPAAIAKCNGRGLGHVLL